MRSPCTTFHKPEHCSPTNQGRETCQTRKVARSFSLTVMQYMLFCPSFTRSTRFLQTDQLVTRLQRVETTCCKVVPNFIRVMMGKRDGDRCSVLVVDNVPHPLIVLSQTRSTMSSLRSHNFSGAVSNLLTVTMHLQDALSRFHCPGLHEVDFCVHVTSASTCTLSFHEAQRCCAVRAQDNSTRRTIAHLAPLVSCCDTLASPTDQCHQLRFA